MEVKNAIIESTKITSDNHGVLDAWIYLTYGGSGQGFGGYVLYTPYRDGHPNDNLNYAGLFIWRVMEIAGVTSWDDLPGKCIRAKGEHNGISEIGHIIDDEWFCPASEFKQMQKKQEETK